MQLQTTYSTTQRTAIEALCTDLTRRMRNTVMVEYGSTDCGQHWAALCVQELPAGSWGFPGPLVSILAGSGIPGEAAVMGANGAPLADGVPFAQAVQEAGVAAKREYRRVTEGTLVGA